MFLLRKFVEWYPGVGAVAMVFQYGMLVKPPDYGLKTGKEYMNENEHEENIKVV
jgi:hypothetical protein